MAALTGKLRHHQTRGFTLIELLVALVAASLLAVMILNGANLATRRDRAADVQGTALALAAAQMEAAIAARRNGTAVAPSDSGTAGMLRWTINENILMDDPRGLHQLIELDIRVTDGSERPLARLSRRLLMRTPAA